MKPRKVGGDRREGPRRKILNHRPVFLKVLQRFHDSPVLIPELFDLDPPRSNDPRILLFRLWRVTHNENNY